MGKSEERRGYMEENIVGGSGNKEKDRVSPYKAYHLLETKSAVKKAGEASMHR